MKTKMVNYCLNLYIIVGHISPIKKSAQRDANTVLAVVGGFNNFVPPQTPFLGARDGQNFTSWR